VLKIVLISGQNQMLWCSSWEDGDHESEDLSRLR
jgi:hypothetical protein